MNSEQRAYVADYRSRCVPFTSVCEALLKTAGIDFRMPLGPKSLRLLNAVARAYDDSSLWPIYGRYSATERAIARLRRQGLDLSALEYAYALDAEISRIVNEEGR
jgi:hypothetical protein